MPVPERILIIRPSALGDVARSVPVLVSLRGAYPNARIDWLVQDSFADVIRAHPALGLPSGGSGEGGNGVVSFPRREFSRWFTTFRWRSLHRYFAGLRDRRYDLVIDAQGLARSGLLAWATRAHRRIGHADARELGWLGYTLRVPCHQGMHTVERMLSLVAAAGATPRFDSNAARLYTPPEARGCFASHPRLNEGRYVVIAPTSRWIAKQWPDDRFAALAKSLAHDVAVVLVGAGNERGQVPRCLELAESHPRIIDLLGRTTIAQLMDLVEHASLVIANDSAALHIAVGFDRPLLALFGPTHVHRVGPYRRAGDVLQHVTARDRLDHKNPSSRELMARIGTHEAIAAARRRLA